MCLSWNIRSKITQSAFERLKTLKHQYKISLICLQEPKVKVRKMSHYMRNLNMQVCYSNVNNKIWMIQNVDFDVNIINDSDQLITCRMTHTVTNSNFHFSVVYAKCRTNLRKELWKDFVDLSNNIIGPYSIMGTSMSTLIRMKKQVAPLTGLIRSLTSQIA